MAKGDEIRLAVDAVVFGYQKKEGVSVLLIRRRYEPFKDKWALPGGFVLKDESLEEAVTRELEEETGVSINYLEQLYTFGDLSRDPRQRVVSVAYFVLVNPTAFHELHASTDATDARWFNLNDLPKLAFDHQEILQVALDRLRAKIRYQPIGFELLDEKFPFSDLEKLYSTLLGREIDRRNFKKKIKSFNIVDELNEPAPKSGPGRPGNLYRFNRKTYQKLQKGGFNFEI